MQLTIKNLHNKEITIEFNAEDTVESLKKLLADRDDLGIKYELDLIKLVLKGKIMDDEDTIESFAIGPSEFILLVKQAPGKPKRPSKKKPYLNYNFGMSGLQSPFGTGSISNSYLQPAFNQNPFIHQTIQSNGPMKTTFSSNITSNAFNGKLTASTQSYVSPVGPLVTPAATYTPPPAAGYSAATYTPPPAASYSAAAYSPPTASYSAAAYSPPTASYSAAAYSPPTASSTGTDHDSSSMSQLVSMGFEHEKAAKALKASAYNFELALEFLISDTIPEINDGPSSSSWPTQTLSESGLAAVNASSIELPPHTQHTPEPTSFYPTKADLPVAPPVSADISTTKVPSAPLHNAELSTSTVHTPPVLPSSPIPINSSVSAPNISNTPAPSTEGTITNINDLLHIIQQDEGQFETVKGLIALQNPEMAKMMHENKEQFLELLKQAAERTRIPEPSQETNIPQQSEHTNIQHPSDETNVQHSPEGTSIQHSSVETNVQHSPEETSIQHPSDETNFQHSSTETTAQNSFAGTNIQPLLLTPVDTPAILGVTPEPIPSVFDTPSALSSTQGASSVHPPNNDTLSKISPMPHVEPIHNKLSDPDQEAIEQIQAMGFSEKQARDAYFLCFRDVTQAITYLLSSDN